MGYPILYPPQVNSPHTRLLLPITETQTVIPVENASKLPVPPIILIIGTDEDAETVLCTSITGNTLTVERAFEGTASAWPRNERIYRGYCHYDHKALMDWVNENRGALLTKSTVFGGNSVTIAQGDWQSNGNYYYVEIQDSNIPADDDSKAYQVVYDLSEISQAYVTDWIEKSTKTGAFILRTNTLPSGAITLKYSILQTLKGIVPGSGGVDDLTDYIDMRVAEALANAKNNVNQIINNDLIFVIGGSDSNTAPEIPSISDGDSVLEHLDYKIASAIAEIRNYTTQQLEDMTVVIENSVSTFEAPEIQNGISTFGTTNLYIYIDQEISAMLASAKAYADAQIADMELIIERS